MAVAAFVRGQDAGGVGQHFELHPTQIVEWKRQLLEHAAEAFGGGAPALEPVDLAPCTPRADAGKVRNARDRQHLDTDQGSQFTAEEFTSVVLAACCKLSMDERGAWRDNVFVERFGAA